MKTVYGVAWIEVEFGQRPEGWKIFKDRDNCIETTKKDSAKGAYGGGYIGPERPLRMYEIPFECLPADVKKTLKTKPTSFTSNYWNPKFKDSGTSIV